MSPRIKQTKTEKFLMPSKYLLLIYTTVSVGLMLLTFFNSGVEQFFKNTIGGAIAPFQKGVSFAAESIIDKATRVATIKELREENKALQDKIDSLTEENTLLLEEQFELADLRALYELDNTYSNYEKTGARIIAWDSNGFYSSFIVDKGTDNGILMDMNVIAGGGLVGRITDVGKNWARVTTILDDNSKISSMVLHTQDHMITCGDLKLSQSGYITYEQLGDKDNLVKQGDKVVTSYVSDKYLPGILIGYIADIRMGDNNLTKSGSITPVVDFRNLTQVLIITQLREDYEDLDINTDR